jgi:DMSO reductase family type II enzyme heme b subunit
MTYRLGYFILLSFLLLTVCGFLLTPLPVDAQTGSVVVSRLVKEDVGALEPDSLIWDKITPVEFPLSAQVHWEPRIFSVTVRDLKVRSVNDTNKVAFLLEYKDPKKDISDAAAIEFPSGEKKAHFAHGQPMLQVEGGPVTIWHWKEERVSTLTAMGFGTLKSLPTQDLAGKGVWKDGIWRVVFIRTLGSSGPEDVSLDSGEFRQIAFAVWDGSNNEGGSKKAISSWWYFRMERPPDPKLYLYTILAIGLAVGFEIYVVRRVRSKKTP